jgi:hypothetical protein
MSVRTQAGKKAAPQALAATQHASSGPARSDLPCSAWSVYRQAIDDGWGSTCRLCLILAVRWGVPVSGGLEAAKLVLAHVH